MQEIELRLTIDEANIILDALGDRPFKDVFVLIDKIQTQAQQQLSGNGMVDPAVLGRDDEPKRAGSGENRDAG